MIEDKFGAELPGLQPPVSSRLPPLQVTEALASPAFTLLCLLFPALPGQEALWPGGLGSPGLPHTLPSPPPSSHTVHSPLPSQWPS